MMTRRWGLVVLFVLGCQVEGPSDITRTRIQELRSGDIETRRQAATIIVLRADPQDTAYIVPELIKALGEKDPILRMSACQSLCHLTREDYPPDKETWERWWNHVKSIREKAKLGDAGYAIQTERAKVRNTDGLARMSEGRFASAAVLFQQAIDLDPRAAYHSNLARCYINLRDYPNALLACEDALAKDPNLQMAYFNMGDAWAGVPGLDHAYEAYSSYRTAVKLDVRGVNWAAHWGLSRLLFRRARATMSDALYDEAAGEIQKAIAIARRTKDLKRVPQLHKDAALIYYGLGRYWQAYKETIEIEKAGYSWGNEDFIRKLDDKLAEIGHVTRREKYRRLKAAQREELPPALRYIGILEEP